MTQVCAEFTVARLMFNLLHLSSQILLLNFSFFRQTYISGTFIELSSCLIVIWKFAAKLNSSVQGQFFWMNLNAVSLLFQKYFALTAKKFRWRENSSRTRINQGRSTWTARRQFWNHFWNFEIIKFWASISLGCCEVIKLKMKIENIEKN